MQADLLKIHPLAQVFPSIEGAEREEFKEDIQKNGQLDPIVMYNGMVLEGRNRYEVCTELGVEPKVIDFAGTIEEAKALVISKNIERRQLTPEQRATAVYKLQHEEFEKIAKAAKKAGQAKGTNKTKAKGKASTSLKVEDTKPAPRQDVVQLTADKAKTSRSTAERVIKKEKAKTETKTEPKVKAKGLRKVSAEKLGPKVDKWCEHFITKFLKGFLPEQHREVIDYIADDLEKRKEDLPDADTE